MTGLAQVERERLCATLEQVGPDRPTLCTPWRTAELAAHLAARDRRPDAVAGLVLPALRGRMDRVMDRYAALPWPQLVRLVREGPPPWSPLRWGSLDRAVNLVELYVHHEDVLRAGAGPRRVAGPELEAALWSALRVLTRLAFLRSPAGVVLAAPGHGQLTAHAPTSLGVVCLTGPPSELTLVTHGRARVADVEATGPREAVAAVLRERPGGA